MYVWLHAFLIYILNGCSQVYDVLHPSRGFPMSFGADLDAMEKSNIFALAWNRTTVVQPVA
jgi:hypothetical protein